MAQISTTRVKLSTIIGRKEFMDGFRDARDNLPFRDNWVQTRRVSIGQRQWSYERGRQFYIYMKHHLGEHDPEIKRGKKVLMTTIAAYKNAVDSGWIL